MRVYEDISEFKKMNNAVVTSGTANLEAALLNVPQVVVYKGGWSLYILAKLFIITSLVIESNVYFSLKFLFLEFLPSFVTLTRSTTKPFLATTVFYFIYFYVLNERVLET